MSDNASSPKEPLPIIGTAPAHSPFTAPRESAWEIILQGVAARLLKRNFAVSIAATLKDAADLVMTTLLPESGAKTVSFGGSMTVRESGLPEALKARPELEVMDNTFDPELRRQSLLCDLYLCSVNAITRDGVLLLLDGFGNRTAAVQCGPRKVVLLVSRNKICSSLESARERVKDIAAPANCVRLNKKTPCAKVGHCMDCNSPDRICSYWTIAERSNPPQRIHVVLINEDAGY
jgi:L-lactate utilization protein LutC